MKITFANVAGVEDARFQSLMPDVLLWLGVTKIDQLMSMSDMKYNAIVRAGIEVVERVQIADLITLVRLSQPVGPV